MTERWKNLHVSRVFDKWFEYSGYSKGERQYARMLMIRWRNGVILRAWMKWYREVIEHKRMLKIKTVWGKEEKGIVHPWKGL